MRNPDAVERFSHPAPAFTGRDASIDQGHVDVLGDIEIVNEVEALKDKTYRTSTQHGEVPLGGTGDVLAEERVEAARGAVEEPQNIEEGGFSTAGGSHDGQKLPRRHLK